MAKSDIGEIMIYVGGFVILYYILKSWGVIQPVSTTRIMNYSFLTEKEIQNIINLGNNPRVDFVKER